METKKTNICIYHQPCDDGFAAAWAHHRRFGDANTVYFPGIHGQQAPEVEGLDVIILDFSYKRNVMRQMAEKANSILIIDHHKSAIEDLAELDEDCKCKVTAILSDKHSGSMLTWLYLFNDKAPPALMRHIEDRDIHGIDNLEFSNTQEISMALRSYRQDFDLWDRLMFNTKVDSLASEGVGILRFTLGKIEEVKRNQYMMPIFEFNVPVCNALPWMASNICIDLVKEHDSDFAAVYWDTPEGRVFSLRSIGDFDVSKVAERMGGGGHKNAAGFVLSPEAAKAAVDETVLGND